MDSITSAEEAQIGKEIIGKYQKHGSCQKIQDRILEIKEQIKRYESICSNEKH